MLVGGLLVLTACEDSIGQSKPPVIAGPGETLTEPCKPPIELPNRALTQVEVETLWRQDRANLIACGKQLQTLVEIIRERDIKLSGVS